MLIDTPDLTQIPKVVLTLAEPITHDLYTDRFYTSPVLAHELGNIGLTLTGTVQANRKGLPGELQSVTRQTKGTVEAFRCGPVMALTWMDKKKILMLSTNHTNNTVYVPPR